METTVSDGRAKAPWHFWAVGVVSLCWNLFGGYDYLMSVSRNPSYLANFPPEMTTLLDAFPIWATTAWALGVWGSVLGAVLLLCRSRHATTAFLVSAAGALVSFAYQATLDMPPSLAGPSQWIMPAIIFIVIVVQWTYARKMAVAGVLS